MATQEDKIPQAKPNDRVARDIARARVVQKAHEGAPAVFGDKNNGVVQKELQRKYMPDTVPIVQGRKVTDPAFKDGWWDVSEYEKKLDEGWEPVTRSDSGELLTMPGGKTIAMKKPYKMWAGEHRARAMKSRERVLRRAPRTKMPDVPADLVDAAVTEEIEPGGSTPG